MRHQEPNKPGLVRALLERIHSPAAESPDLLLQTAVRNSLEQLAEFRRHGGAISNTAVSAGSATGVSNAAVVSKRTLSSVHNAFGFHLFRILAEEVGQNVLISPTSVALTLSMAYNGASSRTQQAMAQALKLHDMSLEEINQCSGALIAMLNGWASDVELHTANSLWMKYADRVLPEFQERCQKYFRAELGDLADAPDTINTWVREHTNGKITHIAGPEVTQKNAHAVLMNAVYFRGLWTEPFDPKTTRELPFTLSNGRKKRCRMMSQSGTYAYLKGKGFQAVRLPYGEENVSLLVFLPDEKVPLARFMALLTPENWAAWQEQFRSREGYVCLPRFRFEYRKDLKAALMKMGMEIAFDRFEADFRQMSPDFYLDMVLHKTFIDVEEKGTEAAAVTEVLAMYGCCGSTEPKDYFRMIVDRPFFCAIADERTEALLFMGAIAEP